MKPSVQKTFDNARHHMRCDVPEGRENETSQKYKAQ